MNRNLKNKNESYKSPWPRIIVSAVLLALLFVLLLWLTRKLEGPPPDSNPEMPEGLASTEVLWVSDGDTIICRLNNDLKEEIGLEDAFGEPGSQDSSGEPGSQETIEGDTLSEESVDAKEDEIVVRLIGFDAPESVHPNANLNTEEGRQASEFVKSKLTGQRVHLELDKQKFDKYGRLLAYVWYEGALFNKIVIEEGYGSPMNIPPNTKYEKVFSEAFDSLS